MTHLSVPGFWRLNKSKYGLVGAVCESCGCAAFPPRQVCAGCGGREHKATALPDSGQILSWTTIHVAPEGFEAPYSVAIIRLDSGPVVVGQVVGDAAALAVGTPVRAVFRKLNETKDGLLLYGLKFAPKNDR